MKKSRNEFLVRHGAAPSCGNRIAENGGGGGGITSSGLNNNLKKRFTVHAPAFLQSLAVEAMDRILVA